MTRVSLPPQTQASSGGCGGVGTGGWEEELASLVLSVAL